MCILTFFTRNILIFMDSLFFRKVGEGKPLVMLHGVFGSSDNLVSVSRLLAEVGFCVYLLDARNHGQSPRSEVFNYDVMADDLEHFLVEHQIEKPILVGHSMGGKVVMNYAMKYTNFEKLVVVDIAPKFYPVHHDHIIQGLLAIDMNKITSRKEAELIFEKYVSSFDERQFILKNIYRTQEGGFDWRINVPVLAREIYQIGGELMNPKVVDVPILFMAGGDSSYIQPSDHASILQIFPAASFVTIEGANHWVHAQKPKEFVHSIQTFALS